jgi:glycosyltransferase involved in cell wall biosynthesis
MAAENKTAMIWFPSWGLGGSTIYLSRYVTFFREQGYRVIAVCRRKDEGTRLLEQLGSEVVFTDYPLSMSYSASEKHEKRSLKATLMNSAKAWIGSKKAYALRKQYKPDVVVVGEFTLLQVLSAFLHKKPDKMHVAVCVQTSVSTDPKKRKEVFRLLEKADSIIGITSVHLEGLPAVEKQHVIPNGLQTTATNEKEAKAAFQRMCRPQENDRFIAFVGGIDPIKGTQEFLHIAAALSAADPDFRFLIIGGNIPSSEDKDPLVQLVLPFIRESGLSEKVTFTGSIPHVEYFLSRSEALINTNTYPHFSRPILEAWNNDAFVFSVEDAFTAAMNAGSDALVFIPRNDPAAAARLILETLATKERRAALRQNSRLRLETDYSDATINDRLLKTFQFVSV